MRLLLTSAGITNQRIANALVELVQKPVEAIKLAFIPTAVNAEEGHKDWFITQLTNLQKFGFNWIDIVDIAADGIDWRARLEQADVIFASGGNTFYLLDQYRKTDFKDWLSDHLETKTYVGASAGSIVATPTIEVATIPPSDRNTVGLTDLTGMQLVNFEVEPHCEGERFEIIRHYAQSKHANVYAIDDATAIKVIDADIEIVSEGKWEYFENE
jgi:dipeptidase E